MAQYKNIDIIPDSTVNRIHLSQGDIGRTLIFYLFENALSWSVPASSTIKCQGTKPSGFGFSVSCTYSGNTVTCVTTEDMTNEYGHIETELLITSSDESQIFGTSNFILDIEKNPHPDNTTDGNVDTAIELTARVDTLEDRVDDLASIAVYVDELKSNLNYYGLTNLFDGSKATSGVRLTNSGTLTNLSTYYTSDYIEVKPNTWYYFNFVPLDMVKVCTYDSSKTFINYYNSYQKALKTEANASYIRFCDLTTNIDVDRVTQESYITNHDTFWVTPEQFGAYGNGVKNDSSYIQSAIDYCVANGYSLKFQNGKTYMLGSALDLSNTSGIIIDFNWCTIKAMSSMNYMLTFDGSSNTSNAVKNVLTNVIADCNGLAGFINLTYSFKFTLDGFLIKNCKTTALRIDAGGAFICQNGTIVGDGTSGSVGIYVATSDCHFEEIVLVDMAKCIYNAGTNFLHKVHGWLTGNVTGTIFFEHMAGFASLVQCQCDTYETGYFIRTSNDLSLISCTYYNNYHLYDSETTPIVFKYNTGISPYARRTSCVNCSFNSPNLTATISNPSDAQITFSGYTHFINVSGYDTVSKSTPTLQSNIVTDNFTDSFNKVTYRGNGICDYDFSLMFVNAIGASYLLSVATINSPYYPKANQMFPCYITKTLAGSDCIIGKLFVNADGSVKIRVPSNATSDYAYVYAHVSYEAKEISN